MQHLKTILVGAALFIAPAFTACNAQSSKAISNVKGTTIENVYKTPDVKILDVRSPEEYAEGHVKGAANINVLGEGFEEKVQQQYPDKKAKIYVYCKSGKRSMKAAGIMESLGYTDIVNVEGGIGAIPESVQVK